MAAKTPQATQATSREAIVGANVRRLRETAGLSQAQLASRLTRTGYGLGDQAVGNIEKGKRRVNVDDLVAFGSALGVTPTSLLSPGAGPGNLFVVAFVGGGCVQVTADEYDFVEGWVRFQMQGRLVHLASARNVLDIRVHEGGGKP